MYNVLLDTSTFRRYEINNPCLFVIHYSFVVERSTICLIQKYITPCQCCNTERGYCFVVLEGCSGHSGRHILPYFSVGIKVRPLKLKTCLVHKISISKPSLICSGLIN